MAQPWANIVANPIRRAASTPEVKIGWFRGADRRSKSGISRSEPGRDSLMVDRWHTSMNTPRMLLARAKPLGVARRQSSGSILTNSAARVTGARAARALTIVAALINAG